MLYNSYLVTVYRITVLLNEKKSKDIPCHVQYVGKILYELLKLCYLSCSMDQQYWHHL